MSNFKIELKGIEKTYFLENTKTGEIVCHKVLNGVDLSFSRGEIHSIVGENGAGKSTLVHILSGLFRQSSGNIIIEGKPVSFYSVKDAINVGISIILQALPLVHDASILEHLMLENEGLGFFNIINKKYIKMKYSALLSEWGIDNFNFERKISELSMEEAFFLELVSTLSKQTKVLILDESISFIPSSKRGVFFSKLRAISKSCNIAVIIITHDINEAIAESDKITVIKGGVNVATLDAKKLKTEMEEQDFKNMLEGYITKKSFSSIYNNAKKRVIGGMKNATSGICIDVKSNQTAIKIDACCGEITGVFFKHGRVFKTFEDGISGLAKGRGMEGGMTIKEAFQFISFSNITPSMLLKEKIGIIPSDRYYRGANPYLSIRDVLSIYYIKKAFINKKQRDEFALAILQDEGIFANLDDACNTLSGGQVQRLMLQRCMKEEPKIIMLFEPLRGLDVSSMHLLSTKLQNLAQAKKTILIFTQEEDNELYLQLCGKTLFI